MYIVDQNQIDINNGRISQQLKVNVGSFLTTDMQVNDENSVEDQEEEYNSEINNMDNIVVNQN